MENKILWVDLEMTGLDPQKDRITEIAAIVTDYEFNEIANYQAVIKINAEAIEMMKQAKWYEEEDGKKVLMGTVFDMASQNGLIERCEKEGREESEVASEFAKFISDNFSQPAVLAGNSIHQDRRFIRQYWQEAEALLHYRMLDVTSYKLVAENKYQLQFDSQKSHRALDDIRESIDELKFYLDKFSRA